MAHTVEQDDTATDSRADLISRIMDWEAGDMDADETLEFFSDLISSGLAWSLQGVYGRTAAAYIEQGYISPEGEVLRWADED